MKIITDTKALTDFCAPLTSFPFITVDTEFMRERTYWPQLCLIQVASPEDEAIIDPLAKGLDLAPLLEVMADDTVIKVFHAARQDVEIFYQLMDQVPAPLFDTQVAAMACGYGDQIGYEPLVRMVTGAQVDKGSRFTDWARRPLTDAQLVYALGDVTHLRDVYQQLLGQLKETNRLAWVREEMDALHNPNLYFVEPAFAWKRLKMRNVRSKDIGPIIELAAWREDAAQTRNVPRGRLIKDDVLLEIARQAPTSVEKLGRVRGIPKGFERSETGKGILNAVQLGQEIPKEDLPQIARHKPMEPVSPDVLDLLRVLLKRQCEAYNVAPKLIASAADIEAIARSNDADVPAFKGWRREVFGDAAIKLKAGEIGLKLEGDKVVLVEHD
ncbi:MAG: ribonuclease D [Parvularculaceae bacterium]